MIATHEPGLNGPLVAGVDVGGGAAAVARHCIGLPEREGVGER
jgi:hypothetical protein